MKYQISVSTHNNSPAYTFREHGTKKKKAIRTKRRTELTDFTNLFMASEDLKTVVV
jgi:hypothetical protein